MHHAYKQWFKWSCEAGRGAHLTKPGWSKPNTIPHPTNLALFGHKIILYRFNQGRLILLQGEGTQIGAGGSAPLAPLTLTTGYKADFLGLEHFLFEVDWNSFGYFNPGALFVCDIVC